MSKWNEVPEKFDDPIYTEGDSNVIPDGEYEHEIVAIEEKANSKGTGTNLVIQFNNISHGFEDKQITMWIPFDHPEQKTKQIAAAKIKLLSNAVGFLAKPKEVTAYLGKKLVLKLGHESSQKDGKTYNNNTVKGTYALRPKKEKPIEVGSSGMPKSLEDDEINFG